MWNPISNGEISVGKPVRQGLLQKVKDNFDYLYGKALYDAGILNGSFEIDSDNDGVPDNWTVSLYAGGQYGYETTNPAHGVKSFKFIHPGGINNGGGYLESDYLEVAETFYILNFILWSSSAVMKNLIHIRYYDKNKNYIGTDDATLYGASNEGNELIYRSITNPTTAKYFGRGFKPITGARYIKIRLIGGYTDTDVAGSTYFDYISLIPRPKISTDLTIAEGYTYLMDWADVGSGVLNVPNISSGILQIDFIGEIRCSGTVGSIRAAVDGGYSSNEFSSASVVYVQAPLRLLIPSTVIGDGQVTLKLQTRTSDGAGYCYAKKAIPNTVITIFEL